MVKLAFNNCNAVNNVLLVLLSIPFQRKKNWKKIASALA